MPYLADPPRAQRPSSPGRPSFALEPALANHVVAVAEHPAGVAEDHLVCHVEKNVVLLADVGPDEIDVVVGMVLKG
jgi:hypothetical protein